MFEKRSHPLAARSLFLWRLLRGLIAGFGLLGFSWIVGILGYHELEGMRWLDATLNAAMILSGMGPVDALHTDAGKWFAACYAIYSGVVFLAVAALVFAPIAHRMLHRFHLE